MAVGTFDTKFTRLLRDLKTATDEGRLAWEETADEDMFRASFPTGMIRIGRFQGHEDEPDYKVWLLDRDAKVVEETWISQTEILLAAELYALARRSARQAESFLDQLLAEVERFSTSSTGSPARRLDETIPGGRFIDADGKVIDAWGRPLDEKR